MSAIKCTGTVTLLSTFVTPDAQFDKVHVDIVGPAPPCAELINSLKPYQPLILLQKLLSKYL